VALILGEYVLPANNTPPNVVLLLYHCGVSPDKQVAVKLTTPASHRAAPTTLPLLGAEGFWFNTPITGVLPVTPVSQVLAVFLQPT
jgi:hypothetical protein